MVRQFVLAVAGAGLRKLSSWPGRKKNWKQKYHAARSFWLQSRSDLLSSAGHLKTRSESPRDWGWSICAGFIHHLWLIMGLLLCSLKSLASGKS
ncbi:MAG: hypothetical protein PHU81_08640 [Acidobacteriota bacterium]|nr:hypothetical protein [Acidobacteriota bacterium]